MDVIAGFELTVIGKRMVLQNSICFLLEALGNCKSVIKSNHSIRKKKHRLQREEEIYLFVINGLENDTILPLFSVINYIWNSNGKVVCGLNYRPVMTRIDFDDNLVFKLGKTPLISSFFFFSVTYSTLPALWGATPKEIPAKESSITWTKLSPR